MDGFKITEQDCHQLLKDNPEEVYAQHLDKLYNTLALSNDDREMYRYQGAIWMLLEVIALKDKAAHQLENN